MREYYILIDNKVKGPLNISQVRSYKLEKDTAAYYIGMPEWSTVEYISELNELLTQQQLPVLKTKRSKSFGEIVEMIFLVLFVGIAFYLTV